MRDFIEWLEGNIHRSRTVVLMATVVVFLLITISLFVLGFFGVVITSTILTSYQTLMAFMVGIYGFFTTTSADKSVNLAEKTADLLAKKFS